MCKIKLILILLVSFGSQSQKESTQTSLSYKEVEYFRAMGHFIYDGSWGFGLIDLVAQCCHLSRTQVFHFSREFLLLLNPPLVYPRWRPLCQGAYPAQCPELEDKSFLPVWKMNFFLGGRCLSPKTLKKMFSLVLVARIKSYGNSHAHTGLGIELLLSTEITVSPMD